MYPQLFVADVDVRGEGTVHHAYIIPVLSLLSVVLSHEPQKDFVLSNVHWFDVVRVKVSQPTHVTFYGKLMATFFQAF